MNVGGIEPGATWQYPAPDGGANFTPAVAAVLLAAGNYAVGPVVVKQTDAAGNVSTVSSNVAAITVDTATPAVPVISLVAGNDNINGAEQTTVISGTAESNATVVLTVGAGNPHTITADGAGVWNYTLAVADITAMGQGSESLSATATDAAGNVSAAGTRNITVDTVAPTLSGQATVNGNQLVLTYSEALDGTNVPAPAAFAVSVNGAANTVNTVAVSGSTVTLTLATAVVNGDTVTVSYTDPTGGDDTLAIQDAAGNDAGNLVSQAVTNNTGAVADITAPTLVSASVVNNLLTLHYNEALDGTHQPSSSYFGVSLSNGTGRAVTNVAINGQDVVLTLSGAISAGETVTVSYQDPSGGNDVWAIQDVAGNDAVGLAGQAVDSSLTTSDITPTSILGAVFSETANATVSDLQRSDAGHERHDGFEPDEERWHVDRHHRRQLRRHAQDPDAEHQRHAGDGELRHLWLQRGRRAQGRREQQLWSGHGRDRQQQRHDWRNHQPGRVWAMASCCAPMAALTTSSGATSTTPWSWAAGPTPWTVAAARTTSTSPKPRAPWIPSAVDQQWPEHAARLRPGHGFDVSNAYQRRAEPPSGTFAADMGLTTGTAVGLIVKHSIRGGIVSLPPPV
ncbi:MAG: hypothetical protein IPL73_25330 [Candidatus Obscuribacter sp.]|nr:hypothetical protein [Candidatus Obscuribacter sp.]